MAEQDRRAETARRELARLSQEGGLFSTPALKAKTRTLRGHFAGADADQSDAIEVWGTRIGRGLAAIAFVVLAVRLVSHLSR